MIKNMCDLMLAADNAKFGDPVVRMGAAAVEVFCHPWVLPPRVAKDILFTGEYIDAEQAKQFGMVNRVVELDDLADETMKLAKHIAKMPPFTVSMIKNSINRAMNMMGFDNAINAHFDTHVMSHWTDEAQSQFEESRRQSGDVKTFLSKRDERF